MDQAPQHRLTGELSEMRARLAQLDAAHLHFANVKLAADQIVQPDALSHNVAAAVARRDFHARLDTRGIERLALDQCELPSDFIATRVGANAAKVAIPDEASARERLYLLERRHGLA